MPIAPPLVSETAPDRLLLTPRQAAAALSISERTLWQLTRGGALPCIRIGRAVRYDPRDLQDYIDRVRS
jgi:excisionase family DNA binding protein